MDVRFNIDEKAIEKKIREAVEGKAREIAIEKGLAKKEDDIFIRWKDR